MIVVVVVVQTSGSDKGGGRQIFVVTTTPRLGTGAPVTATVEGRCGRVPTLVVHRPAPLEKQ
jgi:hypothetical protein